MFRDLLTTFRSQQHELCGRSPFSMPNHTCRRDAGCRSGWLFLVGDSSFACVFPLAALTRQALICITRLRLDAALYQACPTA